MTRPRHVLQAGGALTISTAAAARDQGLPMPAGLLALSPWSDLADNDSSPSWRSQRDFLPPALVQQMARAYAGAASEMEASACNVDLHGFPRTLIVSGESEIFYSQICRLQHKLERAGVEVTHHHAPSMGHVFVVLGLPFGCPAAAKAMDAMATHVAETTNLPPICAGPGGPSGLVPLQSGTSRVTKP
mmetsp:Transcript_16277/g.54815  ORF Transcript_16277/g.54815 Transcript_16277/m.54815 type:complete len:188 (+) Transcript_16277:900-1463(+)